MSFFKSLLNEDRIIVITKNRIIEKRKGVFGKLVSPIVSIWMLFTTTFFVLNNSFVVSLLKERPMTDQEVNEHLEKQINTVNNVLHNIVNYLGGINYYDKFINLDNDTHMDNKKYLSFKGNINNNNYLKLVSLIRDTNSGLDDLDDLISSRIDGVNRVLSTNRIIKEKINNLYEVSYSSKNQHNENNIQIFSNKSNLIKDLSQLNNKVEYLSFVEKTLVKMPIVKPMNQYFLTSKFGIRRDPFTKELKMHNGIDLAGATNSQIMSTADGVVERAGTGFGFGNVVVVNHGNNIKTYYGHLKNNLVKVGDKIKKGDIIGIQGNTGRSTGAHLHYQISVDGKNINPVDFIEIGDKFF